MTARYSWRRPPPPTTGQIEGSWARHSIVERLPKIGLRTLAGNAFDADQTTALEALLAEIPDGPIRPLADTGAPDQASWQAYIQPHLGLDWLTPPWFFIETYFYRRLLDACGWRSGEPQTTDPFQGEKHGALGAALEAMPPDASDQPLSDLLLWSLWGNQADLSLWPLGSGRPSTVPSPAGEPQLADDRAALLEYLFADGQPSRQIEILLDNAGAELLADLALAGRLLADGHRVRLHLKRHPTFVSDATPTDLEFTLAGMATASPSAQRLATRLRQAHASRQLELQDHPFWTSPLAGWEMPPDLHAGLAGADLLLVKGDANYRRLLGDCRWPPTHDLAPALDYLPAPVVLLRALKCELAVGLKVDQIQRASNADPAWMINGRWALIQFHPAGLHPVPGDGTNA